MRQTDLTLEQILQLLDDENNTSGYPGCMLINEIGVIFHEQKDEASENSLLALLDNEKPSYRAIAFCYLYTGEGMVKKHHVLFAEFRLKPENQHLLEEIDEMIFRFE